MVNQDFYLYIIYKVQKEELSDKLFEWNLKRNNDSNKHIRKI